MVRGVRRTAWFVWMLLAVACGSAPATTEKDLADDTSPPPVDTDGKDSTLPRPTDVLEDGSDLPGIPDGKWTKDHKEGEETVDGSGDASGEVTGDVTGDVAVDATGDVAGDAAGEVTGDAGGPDACVPSCLALECGADGCGGSCGECSQGTSCQAGECVPECGPECPGEGVSECQGGSFRECGYQDADPCLEWSLEQPCPQGTECKGGECQCVPDCKGKDCGDDGCGGSCGGCEPVETCSLGKCTVQCQDDCGKEGLFECFGVGYHLCGYFDGDLCLDWGMVIPCAPFAPCKDGDCVCQPQCQGKQCGSDGCGGVCGLCPAGTTCTNGQCAAACQDECAPSGFSSCLGDGYRVCGLYDDDACLDWGEWVACAFNEDCVNGKCICQPQCAGKQCGDDGCGGTCGKCVPGFSCTAGTCTADCQNECAPEGIISCFGNGFRTCGKFDDDSCLDWGLLVSCKSGETCVNGKCVCQPQCAGKQCGDDGCGGTCGNCGAPLSCWDGLCLAVAPGLCKGTYTPSAPVCPGIGFVGCCDALGRANWCQNGSLYCIECPTASPKCGWAGTVYDCGTAGLPDPTGTSPLDCPF